MQIVSDPVETLRQRQQFMDEVHQIARLCNWKDSDCQGLLDHLWDELVRVDNETFNILEENLDEEEASSFWRESMEEIRQHLSMILEVSIVYE